MNNSKLLEMSEDDEDSLSLVDLEQQLIDIKDNVKDQKAKEDADEMERAPVHSLVGPGPPKRIYLNGYTSNFSLPTGSYGEKDMLHVSQISLQLPVGLEPADEAAGGSPGIPNLSILHASGSTAEQCSINRYDRNRLHTLNTRPSSPNPWLENVQAHIEKNFPDICRPPVGTGEEWLRGNWSDETEDVTLVLRSYQEVFAERGLRGENDVILLPTGSGKTYIAIAIIKEHLRRLAEEHVKVVFLAPTQDLVTQQLKLIKKCLPEESHKCRAITGDNHLSHEMVADLIKGTSYVMLVVTPAILDNYFSTSQQASLSDFTLLLFDEMHHTKKAHNYNLILHKYLTALHQGEATLPQLIGMTATIGIGKNRTSEGAKNFILDMCTKYNLSSFPWHQELYLSQQPPIKEDVRLVKPRQDLLTGFIECQLMSTLEEMIAETLTRKEFTHMLGKTAANIVFPSERTFQEYEQYVVNLLTALTQLPHADATKSDLHRSKLALKHLREYYWSLQLINLLDCKSGFLYLERKLSSPPYQGVRDIAELFQGNLEVLREIQEDEDRKSTNEKLLITMNILRDLFIRKPDAKVIIFVQMRVVAQYLAQYLTEADPMFSAREFTSIGKSPEEAGMNPQQRINVRAKFEGSKYNILVATSVLEEGIDIQACIMVIRYMYVKDLIAKIQSMGRARHSEGTLVSLLDEKLLKQERENNFKAGLMFEALDELRGLSEPAFQEELRRRRPILLQTLNTMFNPSDRLDVSPDVEVCCAICSSFLGHLKDVRVFKKSFHLILDASLHERVDFMPQKIDFMDGDQGIGKLSCRHVGADGSQCNNLVGRVVRIGRGYSLGMWHAKGGICVRVGRETTKITKWKDIDDTYQLEPVYNEELSELGPDYQYVFAQL
ncbi:ATP-dependent RNA helicase DHX58-like isoform X1 [Watersipora subatra]|uniref:ATP-dependent RNA helicase DHX58-like isoform X1 n=1 Tax=Watersipora subatra TaxID=2589382 RepID=UPI00355C2669